MASPGPHMSSRVWTRVAGLVAGLAAVGALLWYAGPSAVASALAHARPELIAAAVGCYAAYFFVRGVRWWRLLQRPAPGVALATPIAWSAVGWLINSHLPLKAGDVARATMVARRQRANLANVLGTVAVERLLDVFAVAAVASVGLLAAATLGGPHLPAWLSNALLVAWVLPVAALGVLVGMARWLRRRPVNGRWGRLLARLADASQDLLARPRQIPGLLALSLLGAALQAGIFVSIFLALAPSTPAILVAAAAPIFLLTFAVAFVPGNVGTYEAGFVLAFSLTGIEAAALVPLAIATHLVTHASATTLGGLAWAVDRITVAAPAPAHVEAEAEAVS